MGKISEEHICKELSNYIKNNLLDGAVSIDEKTTFNKIGLDSVSIIEMVLFIERKFGVVISEKDLVPENLNSISALAKCTYSYL